MPAHKNFTDLWLNAASAAFRATRTAPVIDGGALTSLYNGIGEAYSALKAQQSSSPDAPGRDEAIIRGALNGSIQARIVDVIVQGYKNVDVKAHPYLVDWSPKQ